MTRAANAGELTKLRSSGQWARWHVIIDDPDTIYTARATGGIDQTAYTLGFDGGSGTLTNCKFGMTVLVGSSAGAWDRGMARLRKDVGGGDTSFQLSADPSLVCYDNDYITVINDFSLWGRHPIGTTIDVDKAYTDQFSSFIPVTVFKERFTVINAGETVSWDASACWVPGSTISSYSWTFTGATSSTNPTTATPTATYDTSGRFRVALTVTAANGKSGNGYGWVYVLGDNLAPDSGVIISDVEAETEIGWACKVLAYDRPTIHDRARVVVYSEDWYGNEPGSIGPVTDRENIIMAGWIIGETIIREPGQDYVEFTVGGPGVFLGEVAAMPAGLTDSAFPTDAGVTLPAWSKMASLTIVKAFHYLINYRMTLPLCIDVEVEDWTWPAHKLTADDETCWGQLVTFANHGMLTCTPDRYAHLYIQRDAALYPIASRTANIPVIMSLGDGDWNDELAISRRHHSEVAMAEAEGTIYSGGIVTPVGGRAPGDVSGSFGNVENISEVNFPSLATALELAGLIGGRYSAEYESIGVNHPANNHFIDVAPRQFINVTVDGSTLRTIPRRVTIAREDAGQVALTLDLEPEGGQWPAVSIEYPNESTPPIVPPEIPPPPPPPPTEPPEEPPEATGADAVVVTSSDVRITADLDEASPTWTSIISGGPAAPIDSDLPETTNDILYVIETDAIWKCTGVTGTPAWTELWTGDDLGTGGGGVAIEFEGLTRIRVAPGSDTLVYVLGYGQVDGDLKPFVLRSNNGGTTWFESWIDDVLPEDTPYTVTTGTYNIAWNANTPDFYTTDIEIARVGDDVAGTYNPWAMAFRKTWVCTSAIQTMIQVDTDHINNFGETTDTSGNGDITGYQNTLLSAGDQTTALGWLDDYFGTWVPGANPTTPMPKEVGRTKTKYYVDIQSFDPQPAGSLEIITYIFWNKPDVNEPTALDVARTNSAYVYVGTANKVWKSTDGANTWEESLDDHGSNDIAVDPQLAGVYYHWAADGSLELVIADVVTGADLDNETPVKVGLRLTRDLNSGRLWSLKSGTTLRLRNLGSSSDLDTGLSGARGLHCYLGGKLIYLDASDIYYSDDYGATQAAKKGAWAFSGPINAHLLKETV